MYLSKNQLFRRVYQVELTIYQQAWQPVNEAPCCYTTIQPEVCVTPDNHWWQRYTKPLSTQTKFYNANWSGGQINVRRRKKGESAHDEPL